MNCKNHFLANGECVGNILCDEFIEDTGDTSLVEKLIRCMSKDYYIENTESKQIMCEMIDIFYKYNMGEYYKFVLNDCSYDCYKGLKYEKLDIKEWSKNAWEYGLNIFIDSDIYYMFEYDVDTFQEEQDFEGNEGRSKEFIQCKVKLRRLLKRYGLESQASNGGFVVSFRKIIGIGKVIVEKIC